MRHTPTYTWKLCWKCFSCITNIVRRTAHKFSVRENTIAHRIYECTILSMCTNGFPWTFWHFVCNRLCVCVCVCTPPASVVVVHSGSRALDYTIAIVAPCQIYPILLLRLLPLPLARWRYFLLSFYLFFLFQMYLHDPSMHFLLDIEFLSRFVLVASTGIPFSSCTLWKPVVFFICSHQSVWIIQKQTICIQFNNFIVEILEIHNFRRTRPSKKKK